MRQLLGVTAGRQSADGLSPEDWRRGTKHPLRSRAAVSSTLVAGLELARTGTVTLDQDALWTPIRVQYQNNNTAVG